MLNPEIGSIYIQYSNDPLAPLVQIDQIVHNRLRDGEEDGPVHHVEADEGDWEDHPGVLVDIASTHPHYPLRRRLGEERSEERTRHQRRAEESRVKQSRSEERGEGRSTFTWGTGGVMGGGGGAPLEGHSLHPEEGVRWWRRVGWRGYLWILLVSGSQAV